ncbi:nuclear transport factor 2 family protein [Micromonospora purpureochromogenes]|uniref:SnoaL-like domain-containing protein n=1 Tax=Micromonospora purpureochromogenes TaxID=47872 RepID=A0ABX2RXR2_9ACTN|nr:MULTISPECIES: nuclear transport factor 2 family protein [Micromonospora]MBQ0897312.1 nuclear transport factor 2 family protein [Micromonospora sp. U56]NYF59998.1 hypothetical protein [Micromonospora purpureochromogenes]
MVRNPKDVFAHHAQALAAEDLDEIVADYTDDAVYITPAGVRRGKAGVRKGFEELLTDLPGARWELPTQIFENDTLFLEWAADSRRNRAVDGTDTFVFQDGLIRLQTVRYTLLPKD